MKSTSRLNRPTFFKVSIVDMSRVLAHCANRDLQPRDLGVMVALMCHTESYSGQIPATGLLIAEELGMNATEVHACFARLKKQNILRLIQNKRTGTRYYRLHPALMSTWADKGGEGKGYYQLAMREFAEA